MKEHLLGGGSFVRDECAILASFCVFRGGGEGVLNLYNLEKEPNPGPTFLNRTLTQLLRST